MLPTKSLADTVPPGHIKANYLPERVRHDVSEIEPMKC